MPDNRKKPAPNKGKAKGGAKVNSALITWVAVGVVVAVVATIVLIKTTSSPSSNSNPGDGPNGVVVSTKIFNELTTIPASVYDAVGVTSAITVFPPTEQTGQPPLTYKVNGKETAGAFYWGAEYCPYCAATRWGLIAALARFGTFDKLYTMESSSSDVAPNTPTFSFHQTAFASPYLVFKAFEVEDRSKAVLETTPPKEFALVKKYNSQQTFPFINIGNRFFQSTALDPGVFAGTSRPQIAAGLNDPTNQFTQAILTSANYITASICATNKSAPASVCTSSGVRAAAAAMHVTL